MNHNLKELVKNFYNEFPDVDAYLHPDAVLFWNSSSGFHRMDYQSIKKMATELSKAYDSIRLEASHILEEGNQVSIRFTYHVRTIENDEEELPMAHFFAIWEVKDGKLYRGHQMSQQADDHPDNLDSFFPI